jgi:hypothetical protein
LNSAGYEILRQFAATNVSTAADFDSTSLEEITDETVLRKEVVKKYSNTSPAGFDKYLSVGPRAGGYI